ncbi:MAG: hypothetical protein OES32_17915 [Acidobacteriota bacterium]|nr:hypothetical protein [Acidobacteriota bacterium]
MKKSAWGTMLAAVALCAFAAHAAKAADGIDERHIDMLPATHDDLMRMAGGAGLTEEEVGDVDSFGRDKTYLGVSQTIPVIIEEDCSEADPDDICIEHAVPPASTSVDEEGVGVIELPGRATNSLLCFTFTQFSTWFWGNSTGSTQTGNMGLFFTVQVENDALNGLNNSDGFPFNGVLFLDDAGVPTPSPIIVSTHQHTLPDGAFEVQRERTTRSCTGGIVSARLLRAHGLTEAQIKDFFKEPMTVSFGVRGSVRMTELVQFFGGIRVYGD